MEYLGWEIGVGRREQMLCRIMNRLICDPDVSNEEYRRFSRLINAVFHLRTAKA
jgi:hypothetical protein